MENHFDGIVGRHHFGCVVHGLANDAMNGRMAPDSSDTSRCSRCVTQKPKSPRRWCMGSYP